jgi:hypothetical protein
LLNRPPSSVMRAFRELPRLSPLEDVKARTRLACLV